MYPDDGFVVISKRNTSRICTGSMSVSSNGAYRVVAQHDTANVPSNIIYRSSNKGLSWEAIEAPNQTADTSSGAGASPYAVAIADDGTIHATRMLYTGTGTSTDLWYWKYDGSWTAASAITTGGTFNYNNDNLHWIGYNAGTIMTIVMIQAGSAIAYKSTNGTTWSTTTGTAPSSTITNNHHIVWIGAYIHLALKIGGTAYLYRRIDPASNTWLASTTYPSFPSAAITGIENTVIMSAHKSTSELYMGLIDESSGTSDSLYLWKTIDSGENWSTICTAETLGTAWNATARAFRSTGLSIGSDNKLHIWGADKQTGAAYLVYTMTRDYAAVGSYGTPQLAGTTPFSGSRAAAASNGNYDHWPIQRQDGVHDRPYDFWGVWYSTSQLSSSVALNELVLIVSVDPVVSRIKYPISDNPPDYDFNYVRNYVPQYPFHDDSVY